MTTAQVQFASDIGKPPPSTSSRTRGVYRRPLPGVADVMLYWHDLLVKSVLVTRPQRNLYRVPVMNLAVQGAPPPKSQTDVAVAAAGEKSLDA
ncbi:hypothetical protein VMCG_10912 [Cytospora schulzeri]|uniref:Uncharacterized protein n=1 Tax=Cytospora schulzeri TaxID=448051 RepID=A0A423V7V5_9PEZI|nr:hypothetical protein VMCG_10912 [Valsa malicola]